MHDAETQSAGPNSDFQVKDSASPALEECATEDWVSSSASSSDPSSAPAEVEAASEFASSMVMPKGAEDLTNARLMVSTEESESTKGCESTRAEASPETATLSPSNESPFEVLGLDQTPATQGEDRSRHEAETQKAAQIRARKDALVDFLAGSGINTDLNSNADEDETQPSPRLKAAWDEVLQDTPVLQRKSKTPKPKPRRAQKISARSFALAPGHHWWSEHFMPTTWLGRGCFATSFALAWIATDRLLDPFAATPELRWVPYMALAGWICVAIIMFARKMPKRIRFSGAILGVAHSVLLAVSWVWELYRLA